MKYWYILLIAVMLFALIMVSVSEYKQKKRIKGLTGSIVGYLEYLKDGKKIGLTDKNRIGSANNSDIIIDAASIAATHAVIYHTGEQLLLRPVSGETRINGRKALREHEIFTDDTVEFGGVCFKVHIKEAEDED